jgi:hypothetical protein
MGRGIQIHPALVIAGVLAGGEIAGVAGMFLSVPVIAVARIVWRHLPTHDGTLPVGRPIATPRSNTRRRDGDVESEAWSSESAS